MSLAITVRYRAAAVGLVLLAMTFAGASRVRAQVAAPTTSVAAAGTTQAKALAVLEKHCASCHQSERTAPAPPKSALRAILDLEALAREPGWVLPGNPDGSRLVQMMMWRHLDPKPRDPDSSVEITPEEVAAVRAWVKGLPRQEPCAAAKPLDGPAIAELVHKVEAKAGSQAMDTRFVSLAAPYNACATPQQMAAFRVDVAQVLDGLSWATKSIELEAIDDSGALLALRLADLGWSDAHWTTIAAASPYPSPWLRSGVTVGPVVHGGWLAAALASGPLFEALMQLPPRDASSLERLGIDIATARARRIAQRANALAPASQLVISYTHPLDLSRLAAEFYARPEVLLQTTDAARLVARAQQNPVPRAEVEDAFSRLPGMARDGAGAPAAGFVRAAVAAKTASDATTRPPDILLLAEAPSVRVGDKVSFTVTTDRDCHLTVVNVDTLGRATVLFPNEFEPEGRIQAGRTLRLPPDGAGYELRARQPGTETMVATCNSVSAWAAGISHDFERQRFTVLGDYETFVRKSLAPDAVTSAPSVRRRVQRRGKPPPPPPARPLAGQVGRTGILVDIRP